MSGPRVPQCGLAGAKLVSTQHGQFVRLGAFLNQSPTEVIDSETHRGLGPQALDRPFPDLLADARQVGRVQAFPAQQLANGFIRGLSFEVDLELLLCRKKPSFLAGGLGLSCRWIGVFHSCRFVLRPPAQAMVPVALRAPSTMA